MSDTDWQARYESGDTPWVEAVPSPGLAEYLERGGIRGNVLVPGCGFGHDVRAMAKAGASEVVGLELAPLALAGAEQFPRAGLETYQLTDFLNLPAGLRGRFDWLFEHTLFCAIDPARRPEYVRSAAAALKPGGHLLAVFYMNPAHEGEGPPFGTTTTEIDALFDAQFERLEDWMPRKNFEGREGRERMRLYRLRGGKSGLLAPVSAGQLGA